MAVPERGYILSVKDGEELRRLGELLGLDLGSWLAERDRTSLRERMERDWKWHGDAADHHDSTYAHLRAVIENCKHSPVEAIRHQLVGLLPEVQTPDPDVAARMREKGLGHLVDRQERSAQGNWSEYGYGEPPEGWEPINPKETP